MDTFIWIWNIPIFLFKIGFNAMIWFIVLYGTYKIFERLWDGRF
mgnify:CR=1 FL=1